MFDRRLNDRMAVFEVWVNLLNSLVEAESANTENQAENTTANLFLPNI